ncbi:MAG: OmpA family protein [Deltaproteobacteria bacterium]|nr:OmpA family protein [Deltaproteobacteria bacterium]
MGKKQKHEEHENHERWIIPYADMVTLLFAFFVVMYSISQQDLAKLKNVSESVQEAFMGSKKGGAKIKKVDFSNSPTTPETGPKFMVRRTISDQELLDELRKQLTQDGFDFVYQDKVSPINVKIDGRGVVISISAGYLFEQGATEIRPELFPVIQIVADIIRGVDRLILVEGHTDIEPIVGNMFYSNWELSALRATSMVRLLIQQYGIDPTRLTASGYGQYRPVADNATDQGRAQNRRVEIIMLNAQKPSELLEDETVPH